MSRGSSVAIIGAGFGGIATAVQARRAGISDIVILDRATRVGGVWEANTYPGAACDVPSQLYSLSFVPNPRWSRRFSPQAGYVAQALAMLARGDAQRLEVRRELHDAFQRELSERMSSTVWASGCGSWYVNDAGRVTATWPAPPAEYVHRTARLDVADFETRVAPAPATAR